MSENFSQDQQNRKTLRSFYCRDYLWELFEQMTRELGCSMDYLINESMRQYARSRDYSPSEAQEEGDSGGPANPQEKKTSQAGGREAQASVNRMDVGQNSDMEHRTFEQVPAVGGGQNQSPNQNQQQQQPPGPAGGSGGPPPPPSPNQGGGQGGQQQNWQQNQQPGAGGGPQQRGGGQPQATGQTLYLLFNNNRYPIDTDRFVIGRGSQNTDLTIRDGNISRQHCAIIHRNNNWYLKDLDSTNGVEYRGNRIESKRIEEGDVFYLCDYPLQFTYRS
jgi:pSer/pThr/pTyr-binding forkhead associated (FHA) protein